MATGSRSKPTRKSDAGNGRPRAAFGLGAGQTGVLAAAAMAGAALGLAANYGRKMVVQGRASADWADALAAEHAIVLALFDKIEATTDRQEAARAQLLAKLKHALGKHALEEENVIYPALRRANSIHDADALNAEHGYVKTFLFELENMPKASAEWLARIRDFRIMLEEHMRMEEDEVFPALKGALDAEQNARLSQAVHREGMKLA